MNVVLLYLQRNKNLLDFAIGTSLVGLENFEVVIFVGPSFCEILKGERGGGGGGGWRAVVVLGIFLAHKLQYKKLTFYFFVFIFHKNLMEILCFLQKSL